VLFSPTHPDLIFLHAPSVYDFREKSIVYGPVSDLVPSTPIFEMYPVGFSSISNYLRKHGLHVRIINIALQMLKSRDFDVEKYIAGLKSPAIFGIDLHWMPHCHGSVELAKIVKKYHPNTPVVFGGFSSSYFYKELIELPEIDFVMRGDTTEEPMRQLVEAVKSGGDLASIPNLVWKKDGKPQENPFTNVPADIDDFTIGYNEMVRSVFKYRDFTGVIPFMDWTRYNIMAAFVGRGCTLNCVFCGGSRYTFKNTYNRERMAFRSPQAFLKDVRTISHLSRGPIFILGDLLMNDWEHAETVLKGIADMKIKNKIILEFYVLPPVEVFDLVDKYLDDYSYEMSVESHDLEVRRLVGKGYSDEDFEACLAAALKHPNCERFDLYFMVGMPGQTYDITMATVDYCRKLYKQLNNDKRLLPFISPLAPFLDPGSQAFCEPEKHGYILRAKTLEEHRQKLLQPSWKYIMNYETKWMNVDQIVDATYDSAFGLNQLKREIGVVDEQTAQETEDRIVQAREIMRRVDEIMALDDQATIDRQLRKLKEEVDRSSISTVADKQELEWSVKQLTKFNIPHIIKLMFGAGD
jgi:B12-binding domain/radical SAM domain protein